MVLEWKIQRTFSGLLFALTLFGFLGCNTQGPNFRPRSNIPKAGPSLKTTKEIVLVAKESQVSLLGDGTLSKVWAYNGQVPGPTIHLNVGDVLKVRLVNNLVEPTTIHWHGMQLPASMDGSPLAQSAVQPGESFSYEFTVHKAGTYWYHPHFQTNEQIEKGLYGALVVHDSSNENKILNSKMAKADSRPIREETLLLDDVLVDDNYQIESFLPEAPLERARVLANGREGNLLLVNGRAHRHIKVAVGEPIRLRLINAANARFFRLSLAGDQEALYKVGGDLGLLEKSVPINPVDLLVDRMGHPPYSNPDPKKGLLLVPGERAEVLWVPQGQAGDRINLEWHDLPKGRHHFSRRPDGRIDILRDGEDGYKSHRVLMVFDLVASEDTVAAPYVLPMTLKPSEKASITQVTDPQPLRITLGHGLPDEDGHMKFYAQTTMNDQGKMVGVSLGELLEHPELAQQAHLGEVRILEIVNMTRSIHPFHLHGFPFLPYEIEYQDSENASNNKVVTDLGAMGREWKDTIAVPARPGNRRYSRSIVRLLVPFKSLGAAALWVAAGGSPSPGKSGGWLAHCHTLEHAGNGMATWFNVLPQKPRESNQP